MPVNRKLNKKLSLILAISFLISNTAFFGASSGAVAAEFRHGISVFGDLKYPKNFTHFDYVNPNAPKGGEIKYGAMGTFNNLNPFILKGVPAVGIDMIFDSLMESSADEITSKYGLIAKSVKLSDDKKTIRFKLREIARFHDGSKITADDVVFSFDTLKNSAHPSYAIAYRDVLAAQKINDYEVEFIFKNSNNRELPLAVAGLPIFSKQYYSKHEFNKTTFEAPMASGPYQVLKVDPGKSITYERVKDYWAKDLPVNVGRFNFDKISYDYYLDANSLVEAFKSGSYDFRQENIARNWANSYNIPKVANGQIIKKEITNSLPQMMQCFVFNLRREQFQNLNLRKAIALTFDFEWVKSKIFYNSYERTSSFFGGTEFASSGLPSKAELQILNQFKNEIPADAFKEFSLPKTDGSGFSRANLLAARKLLFDAGYKIVNKRLIDPKTKKPVEIEFLIDMKSFQMVVAPMIKNLAVLGIKAKIRLVDDSAYQTRLKNYDYDIIVHIFSGGMMPGDEQFVYWHSSQKDIVGGNNMVGTANPAIDYLVQKISDSKNKDQLKIYTKALDRILLANFYVIPQWHNQSYRIVYTNKFAMPSNPPAYSLALDTWWMK